MKFRWFRFSVDVDSDFSEMNQFLAAHTITSLRQDWVDGERGSILVFVAEYSDKRVGGSVTQPTIQKIPDAMKGLSDHDEALFNLCMKN